MNATKFLLDGRVLFDSARMTLSRQEKIVRLSESECHLLLAFWLGLYKKEEIINYVWKNRSGCVSESSYYKLINQLRNNFNRVGLHASDIVTHPRVGISLSIMLTSADEMCDLQQQNDDGALKIKFRALLSHRFMVKCKNMRALCCTSGVVLLIGIILIFIFPSDTTRNKSDKAFTLLGEFDGYIFFKMKTDKVTFKQVIAAYTSMTLKPGPQNGHYLYYIREPDINLLFQCLNPIENVVPKCLTIKEQY
ncbi:winged helix-turn-helix domain-containing protein [Citrobacter sedlakii]|uniref:winged helix-turn-helix domain-containing protein n=1 Tax=Citrobacter sedlakii TaxID=67826 RepID=UPI0005A7DDA6|nr:membrane protein [Citrobacter sedlakii]